MDIKSIPTRQWFTSNFLTAMLTMAPIIVNIDEAEKLLTPAWVKRDDRPKLIAANNRFNRILGFAKR